MDHSESERSPETLWFWQHYDETADHIRDFLASDGKSLEGKDVADIGCGDGITDLGLVHKTSPVRLVGFDVNQTNTDVLSRRAQQEGVGATLPPQLDFVQSGETSLPAGDASFDYVITWSAFEHIQEREIHIPIQYLFSGIRFLCVWRRGTIDPGRHCRAGVRARAQGT